MGLLANRNASALARSCASAAAAENTAARTIRTGSAFTAAETSHGNPAENLLAARLCLSDRLWLSWRASGFLRKAAAGLAAILPAKLARPVCCCRCTYCGQPFRNGISYAGCGRDPSVPDGLFRTGAGFDLFVYDVLWAGKRDAVCAVAFRHGTEKRNVASAACISACGSCFCRAVHARHRFSAGEQPDPRLFLFCSRA